MTDAPRQPLIPFDATARLSHATPCAFEEYLERVEITGRCQRPDKRGLIEGHVPTLLDRLRIDPEAFIAASSPLLMRFGSAVGTPTSLTAECTARQARHLRGMPNSSQLTWGDAAVSRVGVADYGSLQVNGGIGMVVNGAI